MLTFTILLSVGWIALTVCCYIEKWKPDPLMYGAISLLTGIALVLFIYETTVLSVEDYRSGNYKMEITTEIVDGEVKSDTTYLKK